MSPCGKPKSVYTRSRSSTGALDSFHLCRPCTRNTSLVTRAHTVAPHQLEPAALWPTSSHSSLKCKHIRLDDAALAVRPISLTKFEFDFSARRGHFYSDSAWIVQIFQTPATDMAWFKWGVMSCGSIFISINSIGNFDPICKPIKDINEPTSNLIYSRLYVRPMVAI